MEVIRELTHGQGLSQVIFILILVLIAIVLVLENISKFRNLVGIKTIKEIHEEKQENEIKILEKELSNVKDEIDEIRMYSKESTKKQKQFETDITSVLTDVKKEMVDAKIESYRSQLLDFANAIKKRDYSKESYDHILELYDNYEYILQQNNLTNGKIDMAIEYIKKRYAQYMEEGFPIY